MSWAFTYVLGLWTQVLTFAGPWSHLPSITEFYRLPPLSTFENIAANKGRLKMWSLLRKTVLSVNGWANETDNTHSLCWGLLNFLGKLSLKTRNHESVCICIKIDSYAKGSRIFDKSITQLKVTYLSLIQTPRWIEMSKSWAYWMFTHE